MNSPMRLGVSPAAPHVFIPIGFEALFPQTRTMGYWICLTPQLFLLAYLQQMWDFLVCQLPHHLCGPLPFPLPIWMNVSSFTPSLSDFYTVRCPGSSGCFLFLNLLLSFFWLCREGKCIYLCLHLGQKTIILHCDGSSWISVSHSGYWTPIKSFYSFRIWENQCNPPVWKWGYVHGSVITHHTHILIHTV